MHGWSDDWIDALRSETFVSFVVLSVPLSVLLSAYLYACRSVSLLVSLSVSESVCMSARFFVCLSAKTSVTDDLSLGLSLYARLTVS